MVEPFPKQSFVVRNGANRLIRAMVPDGDFLSPTTFSEAEVERIVATPDDRSALILHSGLKIAVALPYQGLESKIYASDFRTEESVLDLRDVTGEAARPTVPANNNQAPAPGDKIPDGSVYAGVSPDTSKPMYALPADLPLILTFNEAAQHAKTINRVKAHGHDDWRVPTKNELNVLFNNRAAIGGFKANVSDPSGRYWSSSSDWFVASCQRFVTDGFQGLLAKGYHSSVRLVRCEASKAQGTKP